MDRLEGNRVLANLLRDTVRPSRAVAFERWSKTEALQKHPDLAPAYKTLRDASDYFASKMRGEPESPQQALKAVTDQIQRALKAVTDQIQYGLNKGETNNFNASREPAHKERQANVREQSTQGTEHER